ncbi:MAG: hypothetical protein NVS3B24_24290 [Candidatus Dormibacteria bacterium]
MREMATPRGALTLVLAAGSLVAVVALCLYGMAHSTPFPQFGLLADAFVHGRLNLDRPVYDQALYHGGVYLPYGPFPAVLEIPLLLFFSGEHLPDLALAIPVALATLPGMTRLWKAVGLEGQPERTLMTMLTLCGSVYLSTLPINESGLVAHVVTVGALTWALALALEGRKPLVSGLLVAAATLTRAPCLFAAPAIVLLYWFQDGHSDIPRRRLVGAATAAAGVIPGVLLFAAYNYLRFDSPFESGYALQVLTFPVFIAARDVGIISLAHFPKNLYYFLVAAPLPLEGEQAAVFQFPWVRPSPWGMGVIFTSPWLLSALWARGRTAALLGLGAAMVLLPNLVYYGIGLLQFGYRYGLDALPFMAALAALAMARRRSFGWMVAAVAYSVPVNVLGAYWLMTISYTNG